MPESAGIQLRAQAVLPALDYFVKGISGYLQSLSALSAETVNEIVLACEEAMVNVISYAYPEDRAGELEVRCEVLGEHGNRQLIIAISDSGKYFDISEFPAPDLDAPLSERQRGGLGIHLMKNMMDEVAYHRQSGRNILTLSKALPEN